MHWLSFGISLFVLGLILYCVFRFSEKANPTPSKTTHNTMIEVAWTIVPVLILVAVAIPSFRLLRTQLSDPKADVLVKVIGHAWYWSYEYPAVENGGGFTFDANLDEDKQPEAARHRQRHGRAGEQDREDPGHRRRRACIPGRCRPSASRSTPSRAA